MASQRQKGCSQNGLKYVKRLPSRMFSYPPQALFTRTSIFLLSFAIFWNTASTCASSVWSHGIPIPFPPIAVTASAVEETVPPSLPVSVFSLTVRPVTYTVAPASPSPRAIPFPTPRLAPVTTATFPLSLTMATPFCELSDMVEPMIKAVFLVKGKVTVKRDQRVSLGVGYKHQGHKYFNI